MPDGRTPAPGGWNRIHFIVDDIAADVERLRAAGLTFRNDIVSGAGRPADPVRGPLGQPDRALPAGVPIAARPGIVIITFHARP
jgi:catechol 2,3-dioxygenase-like lactoylglutathione lyase family enzyme